MRPASPKSPSERAFSHYLRTGQRLPEEWFLDAQEVELKFNPYHDPRNGQFTSAPGGTRTGPQPVPGHSQSHVPEKAKTYRVRKGDTLSQIAQQHKVRTAGLAKTNNIKQPDHIQAGQTLRMPPRAPTPPAEVKRPPKAQANAPQTSNAPTHPHVAADRTGGSHVGHPLGMLSARFESQGNVGTISSGKGDPGGISYGIYQLATKTGSAAAAVASPEFRPWARDFANLQPGTVAFGNQWKAVAARDPSAFRQAQDTYIQRTHYMPVVNHVARSTGYSLDHASEAVRNVAFSVSVQHVGAVKILTEAVQRTDQLLPRTDPHFEALLIDKIYDRRTEYVAALRNNAIAKGKKCEAQTFSDVITIRYPQERSAAQKMLRNQRP
ncbi:LysM peptidoglycan-binding domain-containing protein [Aquisediminimonas sediminicola]|uniref:LysM peptidoglycan-binding domain-containing protein n=1 Tax=Alteraquisediminimonas sediminicola TaxID=2676787 RepID=UPI001C8E6A91|nr:LysM domain-containing protein [Aquisediminimonas sediminicola]